MKTKSNLFLEMWVESRTRFTKLLDVLTNEDLMKRVAVNQNTIGFLIRHIGDVELLFAKNVFKDREVKVTAKTVIAKHDTGEWINLEELKQYVKHSFDSLYKIVKTQTDTDWETEIVTKEFGTKTKAEAFGRIVSHTAYHAGQIGITLKYGQE